MWQSKAVSTPASGKKIAIIGSGPTGLTAAYYLAKNGHSAVIFEESSEVGGMLRQGIPEYRLPKEILNVDLKNIKNAGVEFKTNIIVGQELTLEDLRQRYEAIFISIGAQQAKKIRIEGVELKGVLWG